jgi:hypothetical protein
MGVVFTDVCHLWRTVDHRWAFLARAPSASSIVRRALVCWALAEGGGGWPPENAG